MSKKGLVYAIIPARKGSKGIPGKNKKDFCGKPLVSWTIEAALNCSIVNKTIVTSDDQDVRNITFSYKYPYRYIRNRPKELCEDEVNGWEVAMDAIEHYDLKDDDIIIYLQPTSPLRTSEDIKIAYFSFVMFKDAESLISCCREAKMYYGFKMTEGYLDPIFHARYLERRRQELPECYVPNGAIYIIHVGTLKTYKSFYTPRTKPYIMPKERSVDMDEEIDWLLGEILWRAQNND